MDLHALLEHPLPVSWSWKEKGAVRRPDFDEILRQDVMRMLKFLQQQIRTLRSIVRAQLLLSKDAMRAEKDDLERVIKRRRDIDEKVAEQRLRRSMIDTGAPPSFTHINTTQHFTRSATRYTHPTQSAWDGTAYKSELLASLTAKLTKKLVFQFLRFNLALKRQQRAASTQSVQLRRRQMLRCCFTALAFEALSSQYIERVSEQKVYTFLAGKYLRHAFLKLHRLARGKRRERAAVQRGDRRWDYRRRSSVLRALHDLTLRTRYRLSIQQWGNRSYERVLRTHFFIAWCRAFIEKRSLRIDLLRRTSAAPSTTAKLQHDLAKPIKTLSKVVKVLPDKLSYRFQDLRKRLYNLSVVHHSRDRSGIGLGVGGGVRDLSELSSIREDGALALSSSRLTALPCAEDSVYRHLDKYLRRPPPVESARLKETEKEKEKRNEEMETSRFDEDSLMLDPSCGSLSSPSPSSARSLSSHAEGRVMSASEDILLGASASRSRHPPEELTRDASLGKDSSLTLFEKALEISLLYDVAQTEQRPPGSCGVRSIPQNLFSGEPTGRRRPNLRQHLLLYHADHPTHHLATQRHRSDQEEEMQYEIELRQLYQGQPRRLRDIRKGTQFLKVQRLVHMAKRVFIHLHRLRHISQSRGVLRHFYDFSLKAALFDQMRRLFHKLRQQHLLLQDLQILRCRQRAFIRWKRRFQTLYCARRDAIEVARRRLLKRRVMRMWLGHWQQCRGSQLLLRKMDSSTRRRVFQAWQRLHLQWRGVWAIMRAVSVRTIIRRLWKLWKTKFEQRKKLRKVFELHDRAWFHRRSRFVPSAALFPHPVTCSSSSCSSASPASAVPTRLLYSSTYSTPVTNFQFVFSVFHAWRAHAQQTRALRVEESMHFQAMCFRGITLLSSTLYRWKAFVQQEQQVGQCRRKKSFQTRRQAFLLWKAEAVRTADREATAIQTSVDMIRLRVCLRRWRKAYEHVLFTNPFTQRYHRRLLRHVFAQWQDFKLAKIAFHIQRFYYKPRLLLASFRVWRLIFRAHRFHAKGFRRLEEVYFQMKASRAFMGWPGRWQSVIASQMAIKNAAALAAAKKGLHLWNPLLQYGGLFAAEAMDDSTFRGSEAMPTVTVDGVVYNNNYNTWPLVTNLPIFHNLLERSVHLQLMDGRSDSFGLKVVYYTLRNLFIVWKKYTTKGTHVRKTLLRLKHLQRRLCVEYLLKHWISLVPKVSYRVVTWIQHHKMNNRFYFLFHHDRQRPGGGEEEDWDENHPQCVVNSVVHNKDLEKQESTLQCSRDRARIHTGYFNDMNLHLMDYERRLPLDKWR